MVAFPSGIDAEDCEEQSGGLQKRVVGKIMLQYSGFVMANRRSTFRAPVTLPAEVQIGSARHGATLVDISEAGVRLATNAEIHAGSTAMLRLPLDGALADATSSRELHLSVTVLDTMPGDADTGFRFRCTIDGFRGTDSYGALQRLVFAAERARIAAERDTAASPMATSSERRSLLRPARPSRFSKRSLHPNVR